MTIYFLAFLVLLTFSTIFQPGGGGGGGSGSVQAQDLKLGELPFPPMPHVTQIILKNFTTFIEQHPLAVIMYYTPWCKYSEAFAPQYDEMSVEISSKSKVAFGSVNCAKENDLYYNQKMVGLGYPTLKAYLRGDPNGIVFRGGRDQFEIQHFIDTLSESAAINLDAAELKLEHFKARYMADKANRYQAVAVLSIRRHHQWDTMRTAASELLLDKFDIACKKMGTALPCAYTYTTTASALDSEPQSEPEPSSSSADSAAKNETTLSRLTIYRNFDHEPEEVFDDMSAETIVASSNTLVEELMQFMTASAYPNLVPFTAANRHHMYDDTRPGSQTHIIVICNPKNKHTKELLESVRSLGAIYQGKAVFVYVDVSRAKRDSNVKGLLKEIGVTSKHTPTAAIFKFARTKVEFYKIDPGKLSPLASEASGFKAWVEEYFQGELVPTHSAPTGVAEDPLEAMMTMPEPEMDE